MDQPIRPSVAVREFKQIFLLISKEVLIKAITQRESVVTYIKSCLLLYGRIFYLNPIGAEAVI